jgi:hypothetical protein
MAGAATCGILVVLLGLCAGGFGADAWDGASALRVATTLQLGDWPQESRWTAPEVPMPAPALFEGSRARPLTGHVARPGPRVHPSAHTLPRRESRRTLPRSLLPDPAPSA